uniref:C-type lectin domain-containing protein n=1 Tax=Sinocyclocheilus anshuiensis TaxID=1608454 RepID=A0A671KP28_9TELE
GGTGVLHHGCAAHKFAASVMSIWIVYNDKDFNCVYATELEWYNGFCPDKRPFFCYFNYNLKLVTVNMTWEDALIYCRDRFFDLASATEQYQLEILQDNSQASTTEAVIWMGLRFVAGQWYWLNSESVEIEMSLPECPEEPYRCGAINIMTNQWENRDCEEKLHFLCY